MRQRTTTEQAVCVRGANRGLRFWALFALMMALCLSLCGAFSMISPSTAFADSATQGKTTIEVTTPQAGVSVSLYKVATLDEDGSYERTDAFAPYTVNLYSTGAASALLAWAHYSNAAVEAKLTSGADGKVAFSGLEPGAYLVAGDSFQTGSLYYRSSPTLAGVPAGSPYDTVMQVAGKWEATDLSKTSSTKSITVVGVWSTVPYDESSSTESSSSTMSLLDIDSDSMSLLDEEPEIVTDSSDVTHPDQVTAVLLKDGVVVKTVTLTAQNAWRATFSDMDTAATYEVVEPEVPDGYRASVFTEGDTFVVQNTQYWPVADDPDHPDSKPDIPDVPVTPDNKGGGSGGGTTPTNANGSGSGSSSSGSGSSSSLPQTGQLWWPVPMLVVAGVICIGAGCILRTRRF